MEKEYLVAFLFDNVSGAELFLLFKIYTAINGSFMPNDFFRIKKRRLLKWIL
jgi:hypothetical protein